MATLSSELRNKLERVVIEARDAAETAARAALETLAVHHHEPYPHMNPVQRELRNHLRARARQLGDRKLHKPDRSGKDHAIYHLTGDCAYEHWHRMLFARFLAENNLLIEPEENMAISLDEAGELARDEGVDMWVFASRCAQKMLPQIFRPDDPLLQVSFATEHILKLEKLLASLPWEVFTASDGLGWVYQFWQSKKKGEINRSEVKIGADEISAVTQLFTEPYMVEFLIHNTLGAWWAGKRLKAEGAASAGTEDELRAKLALPGLTWDYLRFVRGQDENGGPWRPAAGTFEGWPKAAKDIKALDPCCGSGHFLVALLRHLVPIRMDEEGLSANNAVEAVLRDNLHGLEIDERCCQIAAFALALAAWTYPGGGGYRLLPPLHIACTGIRQQATEEQWVKLAEQSGMPTQATEDDRIKNGLLNLHRLFSQAPILGSLINPKQLKADVFTADYEMIQPYLAAVLKAEEVDDETHEQAVAAAGMAKAANLLTGKYTLVITNVPYRQADDLDRTLLEYAEKNYPDAKTDLATVFYCRLNDMLSLTGSSAVVLPQGFLYKDYYARLRKRLFREHNFYVIARLGARAFRGINGEEVKVCLVIADKLNSTKKIVISQYLVTSGDADEKQQNLQVIAEVLVAQEDALVSAKYILRGEQKAKERLLEEYAWYSNGIQTGDYPRFGKCFWEVPAFLTQWSLQLSTVQESVTYGGREQCLLWESGCGSLHQFIREKVGPSRVKSWVRGLNCRDRRGVAISAMGELKATLYSGEIFDDNTVVIIPKSVDHFDALWAFCSDALYDRLVRKIDQSSKVRGALLRVPFDLAHWQKIAADKFPNGLPEPESDDPTQWLFHGWPEESTATLQVAVARLMGYHWPAELDCMMRLSEQTRALVKRCRELSKFVDEDGIVCIPSVHSEEPAAIRLNALLAETNIEQAKMRELTGGIDLDDWLRNSFFEQHCKLFHDRPFVWHIWDGRKRDGFHALVNYHKLCEGDGKGRRLLESLTYAYLGEWITRQKDGVKRGEEGAEDRLAAALELQKRLEAILAGEPPLDIFVRWKPLQKQPIGWEPDINDGVRLNIRPFLASDLPGCRTGAGILRYKPNIKWTKDRGKEPQRPKDEYPWFWGWDEKTVDFSGGETFDGNRWNACHYTNKVKQIARETAKKEKSNASKCSDNGLLW
ncbi:Eco57I restriction-modification methylase domain-containing protein [Syntrophus aciditrophicus]|uniref:site-specific DNA-methyltransferase (adenine-specific) n=1 Tax=Syntrophus aciditrophicus (strain SB) TaxID=56780 RepID=Q2LRS4_SYNAS|nr:N-6 DNA methylase [Syntrophus aciditrophicus]ABC76781.1 type II restriction enzyme, methylase subunit [Syntrophus aciditrophicus SB]